MMRIEPSVRSSTITVYSLYGKASSWMYDISAWGKYNIITLGEQPKYGVHGVNGKASLYSCQAPCLINQISDWVNNAFTFAKKYRNIKPLKLRKRRGVN
jgi:hypothetical protein